MPITYSASPYHDDYDETKEFYQILFRPGRAVQARELTQLQTLIQYQIERFGNGIYKEGSFVTPPKQTYDTNYSFVKLQATHNSVDADDVIEDLVGQIVVGQTTGVRAKVVNYADSTTTDPPTIYVKYLNSGTTGSTETFADNEIIGNDLSTTFVRAITSSATGNGTAFSIGESTLFARGYFLYADDETFITEKYAIVLNRIIGFEVSEAIVESENDESLLDPAIGTFNYFAPGADRNKISLRLANRDYIATAIDDPNFIEIIRIQNGQVISNSIDPRFSILGDTLARRTFDQSGNYEVTPFNIQLLEHLRSGTISNAISDVTISRDGLFTAANGGDESLFVTQIIPGKAYVNGYEVDNTPTRFVTLTKARDFANVNSGVVATQLSSFVKINNANSIPAINDIPVLEIYDRYNAVGGTANGTRVGNARVRGIEYVSGNVQTGTAEFNLYIFDLEMEAGKSFTRNAKQVFTNNSYKDFTANIAPSLVQLSGSASFTNSSNVITGVGTRFSTELLSGDTITVLNQRFVIDSIANDVSLTSITDASGDASGQFVFLNTSVVNDADKDTFLIKLPYDVIKTIDPTNTETIYTTKRGYSRTLTAGAVTITAGTDETFAPFSADNYQVVITSGVSDGNYVVLDSSKITRGGSPTGTTLTINVSSDGFTTETIQAFTTVNKTNSASLRKSKTLVQNSTVDFITKAAAQATILSLGKADGVTLKSVRMSNVAFGTSFVEAGSTDITFRYTFDTGQRSTYYDLAKIILKSGFSKPSNPIRVTFDFFTHGSGDYFSVNSYAGINYDDIPTVVIDDKTFALRDYLDFRPRFNDAGTGFTSTGGSTTEFIDPEIDLVTDYQYFLGRTDNISMDENGLFFVTRGLSSLSPLDPIPPTTNLSLYVLRQNPYVFDLVNDVDVIKVENKRFTMKDIGKIENRVKTLEYYTTLSLLERDAQQSQIQDDLGFDRFKNGFLVDSFTGHGIGDVSNPDYSTSINYKTKEASPLVVNRFVNLVEIATNSTQRTANNYVKTNDLITLPFTETIFFQNDFSSKTENLNPFNVVVFNGLVKLDPPGDLWFDDTRVPDIIVDQTGAFDSLRRASLVRSDGRNIFGTINNIEQLRAGVPPDPTDLPDNLKDLADLIGSVSPATSTLSLSGKEVVKNITVIPKMRTTTISFSAEGLRPNTRFFVFFEELNVTNHCVSVSSTYETALANIQNNAFTTVADFQSKFNTLVDASQSTLFTPFVSDASGTLKGRFNYDSATLNVSTGVKRFRLSNSPTNNRQTESSFAETVFFSDGLHREIADQILRPPPPPPPRRPPRPTVVFVPAPAPASAPAPEPTPTPFPDSGPTPAPIIEVGPPTPDPVPGVGTVDPPIEDLEIIVDPPVVPIVEPPKTRLTQIYERIAGRAPDAEGYQYWIDSFREAGVTDPENPPDSAFGGNTPAGLVGISLAAGFIVNSDTAKTFVGPINTTQASTGKYTSGQVGNADTVADLYIKGDLSGEEANQIIINSILAKTSQT